MLSNIVQTVRDIPHFCTLSLKYEIGLKGEMFGHKKCVLLSEMQNVLIAMSHVALAS